jgi:antitoxin VapB
MPVMVIFPDRNAKLFGIGRNQAVGILQQFELPSEDAIVREEGNCLVIGLAPPISLLAIMTPLDEALPPIADLPSDFIVF